MRPVLLATAVTVALLVLVPSASAARLPAGVFVGKTGQVAFGVAIDSRGVLATGSTLSTAPTLSTTSLTAASDRGPVVAPADPQSIVLDFDGEGIDASGAVTTTLLGGGSRFVNWTGHGEDMTEMNLDFLALQAAVQNENPRFTTLSNASKARAPALIPCGAGHASLARYTARVSPRLRSPIDNDDGPCSPERRGPARTPYPRSPRGLGGGRPRR